MPPDRDMHAVKPSPAPCRDDAVEVAGPPSGRFYDYNAGANWVLGVGFACAMLAQASGIVPPVAGFFIGAIPTFATATVAYALADD